jgi:hypothetical protein
MTRPKTHGRRTHAATPAGVPGLEFRPYVPPSFAPVRKGAEDYKRCPSVAAGLARPYWAAGLK